MNEQVNGQEFDVANLFPAPARTKARRSLTVQVPWYAIGHLSLAVVAAAVVWACLPIGAGAVDPGVRVGATSVAAVIALVVWARFGPLAAVGFTLSAGALCAGVGAMTQFAGALCAGVGAMTQFAGAVGMYAPVAVAVVAMGVVAGRAVRRRRDGEP